MNTDKLIISRQELAAAALFASKDESRYVITGVLIDFPEGSKPRLISTDGRRITVINSLAEQESLGGPSILIRPDFIKLFVSYSKACGGKLFPWLRFELVAGGNGVCVSAVGGKSNLVIEDGCFIEGQFPEWQKTLPSKRAARSPISDLGLNSEFIGDYAKAAKLLEADSPIIQMNLVGSESMVEVRISGVDNFYSLLCQTRINQELEYQPEFVSIINQLPQQPQSVSSEEEEEE
jgi:hypothetical protein